MIAPLPEGTWFGVPLRKGGWAVGLIARTTSKGKVLLGYFFGPRQESLPSLEAVSKLRPNQAARVLRFGDLSLIDGSWPVIGRDLSWERGKWPMPIFVRKDELSATARRVYYHDLDPNLVIREEPLPFDKGSEYERAAVFGAGAVEIALDHGL